MTRLKYEPPYQTGDKVLVLGSREGNIGGSIADELERSGWIVTGDDCKAEGVERYEAPNSISYHDYDVCVITLGVTHMEPFSEVSKVDMEKVLYGSLVLPLECARRYVQARMEVSDTENDTHGHIAPHHSTIIFIGSYAHDHPFTHCTTYCAAKAGLNMAAQALAWELMPEGFHVHIINPHHVQGTPMTEKVRQGMMKGVHQMTAEEAEAYSRKDLRMPDLLDGDDIAEMVLTILENLPMGWLSGQPINMYGGCR
jgi:NAD(P)-dependent dehydrogenase (short-subunit alcohol dehydrogenase family)